MSRSTLTLREAAIVSAICFGLFILWSTQAVLSGFPQARFSDGGNFGSILIEAVLAACALLYLRSLKFEVHSLYPRPDWRGTLVGIAAFAAAWIVGIVVTAPFVSTEPLMSEFSFDDVSLVSAVLFAMANGTFEEVFLLGVLVRGLRGHGVSVAVGLPLLVRVLYHLYQGPLGAVWILAFGLTFTAFYLRFRMLWPLVLAHMLWDIVPIYVN